MQKRDLLNANRVGKKCTRMYIFTAPAVNLCSRLVSTPSIFKSAGCKGISFVAAHKLILNVSEPPWTAVVSSRSQFASANWQPKNEQGCSFLGVPAVNLCSRLVSTPSIFKSDGSAAPPRTGVVISSSEICGIHKSRR